MRAPHVGWESFSRSRVGRGEHCRLLLLLAFDTDDAKYLAHTKIHYGRKPSGYLSCCYEEVVPYPFVCQLVWHRQHPQGNVGEEADVDFHSHSTPLRGNTCIRVLKHALHWLECFFVHIEFPMTSHIGKLCKNNVLPICVQGSTLKLYSTCGITPSIRNFSHPWF